MHHYHFQDFLARFDQSGDLACACGSRHHVSTRTVIAGDTALEESAALLGGRYGSGSRLWILSDQNTEAAAGARWKSLIGPFLVVSRVLPGHPKLHPTTALVDKLCADVREARPDLIVSIGGGVISDLGKRVSLITGIPNWCVATAPSVDAYSSATSAISVGSFHQAVPARVSEVIVCDLAVMRAAPREMHLAGLGDLLAKYLACLDWNLARIITEEAYCPLIAATTLDSARGAIAAVRHSGADFGSYTAVLVDAGLSSGFAMQALGGSRAAASAEHTMAHYWESTRAARNERLDLHGILAGAASRLMLHAYRGLYGRLAGLAIDDERRLDAFDAEPPWQEAIEEGLGPFLERVNEEMSGRVFDRDVLARRLQSFRAAKGQIMENARRMLDELEQAVEALESVGFPFSLAGLGLDVEAVILPFRHVRYLRRRYSSFDLAYEAGEESFLRGLGEAYARQER